MLDLGPGLRAVLVVLQYSTALLVLQEKKYKFMESFLLFLILSKLSDSGTPWDHMGDVLCGLCLTTAEEEGEEEGITSAEDNIISPKHRWIYPTVVLEESLPVHDCSSRCPCFFYATPSF